MKFNSIKEIQEHKFIGNHYHDMSTFDAIEEFVLRDDVSIQDKAEALRVMTDHGMGCGRDEETDDHVLVEEYLNQR